MPKHKKKYKKKAKQIKLQKPDPLVLAGSSPYAEYLPERFRQYDPEKKKFEHGQKGVISGAPEDYDPDHLMEANFGSDFKPHDMSRASKRPDQMSKRKKSTAINFYNDAKSSAQPSEFHRAGEDSDMSHSEVGFQQNYKVKPHREDVKGQDLFL